jgi:hypothetical protein
MNEGPLAAVPIFLKEVSMAYRFTSFALGIAAAAAFAGTAAAYDPTSQFAPRCQIDELRPAPAGQDPCAEQFAVFGLKGPVVMAQGPVDIDTTGSVRLQQDDSKPSSNPRR